MIFTVGHSNLDPGAFVDLLLKFKVGTIIDIRSHPTSYLAHFRNFEWLKSAGFKYEWEPDLGGWRAEHVQDWRAKMLKHNVDVQDYAGKFPKHVIARDREGVRLPAWTNQGLYDFSWYTTTPMFRLAAERLADKHGRDWRIVGIMCAEVLWWKCHRSIVADYLTSVHEVSVHHIQPKPTKHDPNPRMERYDPKILKTWR